jgi:hypothetical protein
MRRGLFWLPPAKSKVQKQVSPSMPSMREESGNLEKAVEPRMHTDEEGHAEEQE